MHKALLSHFFGVWSGKVGEALSFLSAPLSRPPQNGWLLFGVPSQPTNGSSNQLFAKKDQTGSG